MLWNVVYEFFVRYIFGGYYDGVIYEARLSYSTFIEDDEMFEDAFVNSNHLLFNTNFLDRDGGVVSMSLGNYLSLIATIITINSIIILSGLTSDINGVNNCPLYLS